MAVRISIFVSLALTLLITSSALNAEEILTNEGVVKLHEAGLPANVVAAKVKQAEDVSFDLETDDLLALTDAGLPSEVITAMLERASGNVLGGPGANPFGDTGFNAVKVRLVTSEGQQKIRLARGESSVAAFGYLQFLNYNGRHARIRTYDKRPVLHVESVEPLADSKYFLVKLDVDDDDGVRSLKISSARKSLRSVFGGTTIGANEPDDDWVVPWKAELIKGDLWKVTVEEDLPTGEYGLYIDMGTFGLQGGGLFGFGVDPAPSYQPEPVDSVGLPPSEAPRN